MAFVATPSSWLGDGYSANDSTHTITLPIAGHANQVFTDISDAEANASSGDIRKIMYGLMEGIYTKWNAANSTDRPTNWTMYKTSSVNTTTGIVSHTYQVQFNNTVSAQEVANEPT